MSNTEKWVEYRDNSFMEGDILKTIYGVPVESLSRKKCWICGAALDRRYNDKGDCYCVNCGGYQPKLFEEDKENKFRICSEELMEYWNKGLTEEHVY